MATIEEPVELVDAGDLPPHLATRDDLVDPHVAFFDDGREGTDRWGRERRTLRACGTSWEDVCPAYLEESCAGDGNPGFTRLDPLQTRTCGLECARCGGGDRVATFTRCGWGRGDPMWDGAIAEVGGSLRLDRFCSRPPEARAEPWPAAYIPVVEAYASNWIDELRSQSMIGTTMQTAIPPKRAMDSARTIRERLGGYEGRLMLNGLVKDDLLDDAWDDRDRVIEYALRSRVDVMIVHQFSYYDGDHTCAHLYNANRAFMQYDLFREAGFPVVAMELPSWHRDWLFAEWLTFCRRSDVAAVAISLQTVASRGGVSVADLNGMRRINQELPDDCAVLFFGVGTVLGMAQITRAFDGRCLAFSGKEPYAQAIFFQMMPYGTTAPKKLDKQAVFAHNLRWAQSTAAKIRDGNARRRAPRI